MERYQRQTILKEMGTRGQQKLLNAKVLVIGAGGLGSPALQYLAAAGIGCIGIMDHDAVELSNLQRQTLYRMEDIGHPKTRAAYKKIHAFNPQIRLNVHPHKLESRNALDVLTGYDVIIDGSDNYPTRYLANDACVILNKPLIYGAVLRFEGQVGVLNVTDPETGHRCNYRDLFPEPAKNSPSCNEVGVLGVLPGIIGTMQAGEAIKIITGVGKPLINQVLTYNLLENSFYTLTLTPHPESKIHAPKNLSDLLELNYNVFCHIPFADFEISSETFDRWLASGDYLAVDVREPGETPAIREFECIHIPLASLEKEPDTDTGNKKLVFVCSSGKRSLKAVGIFKEKYPDREVYSLEGGILSYQQKKKIKHERKKDKKSLR